MVMFRMAIILLLVVCGGYNNCVGGTTVKKTSGAAAVKAQVSVPVKVSTPTSSMGQSTNQSLSQTAQPASPAKSNVEPTSKIPVPNAGEFYTIADLFRRINTNNPQKTSNFLVPLGANKKPIDDSHCWQTNPQINGSASASVVGLTPQWIQENGSTTVQLYQDVQLIDFLASDGRLTEASSNQDGTKLKYKKILLYFKFPMVSTIQNQATNKNQPVTVTYRCYLNDPYPGRVARSVSYKIDPAASIISRWDV